MVEYNIKELLAKVDTKLDKVFNILEKTNLDNTTQHAEIINHQKYTNGNVRFHRKWLISVTGLMVGAGIFIIKKWFEIKLG